MKTRSNVWSERFFLLILFSLLALLILTPLTSNSLIPRDLDYQNHLIGVMEAKRALIEGQFPLRSAHYQSWRYPLFQFYSPTSYTLAGLIYQWLAPSNPLIAEKILLWFLLVISGIYFYRLAFEFVRSRPAATLAAVAYLTMPYYLIAINYIGALNEAAALSILPAVLFYTLQRYAHPTDSKTLLKTALAWYLLITTHLVTAVTASFFVALMLFIMTCRNRKWINLLDVAVAYAFACFLAMWYLWPIASLHNAFLVSRSFDNSYFYEIYKAYGADLFSLLGRVSAGVRNPDGDISALSRIHPNIGFPVLAAVGIALFMFFKKSASKQEAKFNYWLPVLLLVFFVTLFLAWSPVNIWHWLPQSFFIFQYTWRLLGQLMWIGALLLAGALCWMFEDKLDARHTVCGVIILIVIAMSWFPTGKWGFMDFRQVLDNPLYAYNNDYLIDTRQNFVPLQLKFDKPVAKAKIPELFIAATYKLDPATTLSVEQMKKNCRQERIKTICEVNVPAGMRELELPVLAYPDLLDIRLNGNVVDYRRVVYRDFYVATIKPVVGVNRIVVEFKGSSLGNLLSEIAWGVLALFFVIVYGRKFFKP